MGTPFIDLTGQRYGRLTVQSRSIHPLYGRTAWHCLCDCGTPMVVTGNSLRRGNTKSCGCLKQELAVRHATTHGLSHIPEWEVFHGIVQRCTNPNHISYQYYGARGIVCTWSSFEEFYQDMGPRPGSGYSVERNDNDGPYSKKNCHWATRREQNRNSRQNVWLIYHGKRMLQTDVARLTGLSLCAVQNRVRRGIPLDAPRQKPGPKPKPVP